MKIWIDIVKTECMIKLYLHYLQMVVHDLFLVVPDIDQYVKDGYMTEVVGNTLKKQIIKSDIIRTMWDYGIVDQSKQQLEDWTRCLGSNECPLNSHHDVTNGELTTSTSLVKINSDVIKTWDDSRTQTKTDR